MIVATREVKKRITKHYEDGSTKIIHIIKYYNGNDKTPNLRWKIVDYITPDGIIDKKRSYDTKLIINNYNDYDAEYIKKEIETSSIIHYDNNSTNHTLYWEIVNVSLKSIFIQTKVVMENRDGSIDKDNSWQTASYDVKKKNGNHVSHNYNFTL